MKSKKVSILSAIIIGVITGLVTISGIAFGASKTVLNNDSGLSLKDAYSIINLQKIVEEIYYEDTSDIDFSVGLKKGLVEALDDPYSRYLTIDEYKKDMEDTTGSFEGIGVYIAPAKDNTIIVIAPIKDSPAYNAGIESGDKILKVNGVNYDAKTMQDAVNVMRGKKGESVKIELLDKNGKIKIVDVIRDTIKNESVYSKMLGDIGYISIISFDEDTGLEFEENYKILSKNSPKGLIIDLRSNPGGMLDQVINVADQILPEADLFYTNNKNNHKEVFTSTDKQQINLPIVVLVDNNSASASEILAGALQDNEKAIIVGETTFGKGLVQSFFQINDEDAIIITTAQYFTPKGNIVNGVGISPDIIVESSKNTPDEDYQLKKAIEVIQSQLK